MRKPRLTTPRPKFLRRIEATAVYLVSLYRQVPVSLTESANFVRTGVLQDWCTLGSIKRTKVFRWATDHTLPLQPLQRHVLHDGRTFEYVAYRLAPDHLLLAVLVLEGLRRARRSSNTDIEAIERYQARLAKSPPFDESDMPASFFNYLLRRAHSAQRST